LLKAFGDKAGFVTDGVAIFIALKPEDPFTTEDFASGRYRGTGDELVNPHIGETFKFVEYTSMPAVSVGRPECLTECDGVRGKLGIDMGGCEGGRKGLVHETNLLLMGEGESGERVAGGGVGESGVGVTKLFAHLQLRAMSFVSWGITSFTEAAGWFPGFGDSPVSGRGVLNTV
jgi:hypothetical protein